MRRGARRADAGGTRQIAGRAGEAEGGARSPGRADTQGRSRQGRQGRTCRWRPPGSSWGIPSPQRTIEGTLTVAVVIDSSGAASKRVQLGARVSVRDVDSRRETTYTLVSATEANPLEG